MRIYLPENLDPGKSLLLDREFKKRLVRVMRLRPGDSLEVFAPGKHWECRVAEILPDGIKLEPVRELPSPPPPSLAICLGHALTRGEKFDWLVQKATELGVTEIIPLVTHRTIVKPDQIYPRLQRWNEIAEQAAGQSENAYPPDIYLPETPASFLQRKHDGLRLILLERAGVHSIKEVFDKIHGNRITVVVGPEGGWTPEESRAFTDAGFQSVSLGRRILRAETAGLAMLAIIQYQLGDLN